MDEYIKASGQLLDFIDRSPSPYHVIDNIINELTGYTELEEGKTWSLKTGGRYYVTRNSSSLIAFRIPDGDAASFKICAAHSDSPAFKIKPNAEIEADKRYTTLNVEKYGGMLISTWLDRPLSVAGRIIYDDNGNLTEKLVNIDRDLLIIPNVAIHMNRDANDGIKYDPQKDLKPLFAVSDKASLTKLIADEAGVDDSSILGSDLFLYNRTKGTFLGADKEMIASRCLDDLQCVYGLMRGFIDSSQGSTDHIPVLSIFDNEEVGSLTRQGADSTFLYDVLSRICEALRQPLNNMLADSFMISADNAHAVHPNRPEYADPTNRPCINGGIVIKYNGNRKYTTDARSEAVIRQLCQKAGIPVQTYANRSDIAGGSTLGNLSGRHVSVSTVDIGLAQLAMHSSYETAGARDIMYLIKLIQGFFN